MLLSPPCCEMPAIARIQLALDIAPLPLDLDSVVPLSLLLTELASNTMKHAYPADRSGSVSIRLAPTSEGSALTVSDDGIGIPTDTASDRSRSLGLRLVHSLVRQLSDTFQFRSLHPTGTGTVVTVAFPAVFHDGGDPCPLPSP